MPSVSRPEQTLLTAAQAGDPRALETLLERYYPRVLGFGRRMCRDDSDGEDVAQDTLLAAARTVRRFRGGASLSTWLYTIARSFCIKKRRRGKFAPAREESIDHLARQLPADDRSPEQAAMDRELEVALVEAIAGLEPMYKEVLLLRDVEGLTAPEVASVIGISVGAVKSRLHRARTTVRRALASKVEPRFEAGVALQSKSPIGSFR